MLLIMLLTRTTYNTKDMNQHVNIPLQWQKNCIQSQTFNFRFD